ncbi:hypothetical protein BG004_001330 [Podila humilis]|nr:hypothetical protein BG004_001330 [Podila humilis]
MEQALNASGIEQILGLPDPCKGTFLSFACSSAYPRPVSSGEAASFNVLFACKSACKAVHSVCTADLTLLEATANLPNCDAPIQGTEQFPGGAINLQDDASCNVLPGVSAGLCLILMISYLVLPDKLQHPSNLILFSAVALFIFSSAVIPSYGNPKRIQCAANGISTANSHNNTLCMAQGAWVLFGAIASTVWLSLVIVNLHLHTVWNSNWLSRRAWLSHIAGWFVPAAFAAISVITKSISWNNSNMCMASQETSNALLFIPLGVVIVPSFLLHLLTFGHIIRISLQSESSETVSHSTLSSGKAARISHRRHVMNAMRIQWRAAMLALVIVGSILVYWAFYLIAGTKTDMSWMSTWQLCIFLQLGDQEQCGKRYAAGHVPDFIFMIIAEGLVSTTGIWIFLLFFKRSLMAEWRELMSGWSCFGRKKRSREDEQFYVI